MASGLQSSIVIASVPHEEASTWGVDSEAHKNPRIPACHDTEDLAKDAFEPIGGQIGDMK
jgi:hypothetical protein